MMRPAADIKQRHAIKPGTRRIAAALSPQSPCSEASMASSSRRNGRRFSRSAFVRAERSSAIAALCGGQPARPTPRCAASLRPGDVPDRRPTGAARGRASPGMAGSAATCWASACRNSWMRRVPRDDRIAKRQPAAGPAAPAARRSRLPTDRAVVCPRGWPRQQGATACALRRMHRGSRPASSPDASASPNRRRESRRAGRRRATAHGRRPRCSPWQTG